MPSQLVIDLGTCHTVAVLRRDGQAPRTVLFDGSPLLPSGVYRDPDGSLTVGRDAVRLSTAAPGRFEPYPKRNVDDGTVLLGDAEVPVVELFAALLRRATTEALSSGSGDFPESIVLTCPADWGQPRRDVLRQAARIAGLGEVRLVDEPIAAATYCVEELGLPIPAGQALLVFDFGGGTLDVTVVGRDAAGLRTLAVGGLDDLGGVDVDAALVGHLGAVVAARDPRIWQRLSTPDGTGELRDRQAFWAEVRAAKEMLSRATTAPVHVPGREDAAHLTRDELDRVAGPLVDRAVDETRRTLDRAGVGPDRLAGILLVGGSSRMPLVATRLHARFRVAPTVPEQPEFPVALGALRVTAPATMPKLATLPPLPPKEDSDALPLPVPEKKRWRRTALSTVFSLVVVGAFAWPGGPVQKLFTRTGEWVSGLTTGSTSGPGGGSGGGDGAEVVAFTGFDANLPGRGGVAVTAGGDAFYTAATEGNTTVVRRVGINDKDANTSEGWTKTLKVASTDPRLRVVGELLIVDAPDSTENDGKDWRLVLDAKTGNTRWGADWSDRTDLAYYGTEATVAAEDPFRTLRFDLKNNKLLESREASTSQIILEDWVQPARVWAKTETTATLATTGPFEESLGVDPTRLVELDDREGRGYVLDAKTLAVKKDGALPIEDEFWTVFGDHIVGLLNDEVARGKTVLAAYGLADFKQKWTVQLEAGDSVEQVRPCAPKVVCVAVQNSKTGNRVIGVNLDSGKDAWAGKTLAEPKETAFDPGGIVVGGRYIFGDSTFSGLVGDPTTVFNGENAEKTGTVGHDVRAAAGHHLLLLDYDGTSEKWIAGLYNVTSGKFSAFAPVGPDLPADGSFAVNGPAFAVIGKDRKLYLLRAPALV